MDIDIFHKAVRGFLDEPNLALRHQVEGGDGWDGASKIIEDKRFTVKSTGGYSSRVINHWASKGLLGEHNHKDKWKKFNFIDLVWLRIIRELRLFGMPLEKIENTRASLYTSGVDHSYLVFRTYICLCLRKTPQHIYLLVFSDGNAHLATENRLELVETMADGHYPFIKISINRLCREILNTENYKPLKTITVQLEEDELEVFESILMEDYKELTAKRTKNGVNITKIIPEPPDKSPLNEAISGIAYGDILLRIEKGKVVSRTKYLKEQV
ncbi:MAG: MerR family transcriptional regulator [Alphaproteobacteria bacterium]|nr:MerR family transcriptional regulator [Alphaproteobacteria bacterium]